MIRAWMAIVITLVLYLFISWKWYSGDLTLVNLYPHHIGNADPLKLEK